MGRLLMWLQASGNLKSSDLEDGSRGLAARSNPLHHMLSPALVWNRAFWAHLPWVHLTLPLKQKLLSVLTPVLFTVHCSCWC